MNIKCSNKEAVSCNAPSEILKEKFTSFPYFLLNWILGKVCIVGLAFKLQEKNVPCVKILFTPVCPVIVGVLMNG